MKEIVHPFVKYGAAVVMVENNLSDSEQITKEHLINEIEKSKNHFRLKANDHNSTQKTVNFIYTDEAKGNPSKGIYLSPSVLASDMSASKILPAFSKILEGLRRGSDSNVDITRAITPITGEFTSFGTSSVGRGKQKMRINDAALCLITTTTEKKPAFAFKISKKAKTERENLAIIPDLEINELTDFINLFEKMKNQSTENLFIGNINEKDDKPLRPKIFDGNFPNAPRSSSLGAVGLLGAIGSWAKNAEDIEWAKRVLSSLEDVSIYLIGTKTFQTFKFNHFIIELAKESKLSSIIDSAYYTVLYNQGKRNAKNKIEYEKFDLFLSRFLQLFSIPAFKDFLSFRAEYPNQFELLLNKYFMNMENIEPEVVKSARELGKWLNYAAYKVADRNIEENAQDRYNKVRELKAKSLIEIESSIFSARDGGALIFQAITRAGRASGLDAPAEAELFMTEASTGGISLESAKHLLIAFSRVKNKYEKVSTSEDDDIDNDDESDEQNDSEDLSDAQE